ncbi:MAG: NlpC/P60 family protein [Smithellaceae bacterium]|nr:NlpC/P60 family protein [Smithellaceae bacterium]
MVRRIFLWMGLIVLFLPFFFVTEISAQERYKVKAGDTLSGIAGKFNLDVQDLKKNNNLTGDSLRLNQVLLVKDKPIKAAKTKSTPSPQAQIVPAPKKTYLVKTGDTLGAIAKNTGVSVEEIKAINKLKGNKLAAGRKLALKRESRKPEDALPSVDQSLAPDEEGDGDLLFEDGWAAIERDKWESSKILDKWKDPGEQQQVVRAARAFLGAPYRYGGNTVRGIDCSAYVKVIYDIFGIQLPRTAREQSHVGELVARDSLKEGDLVFFNTRRALGHVGIYIGNNEFLHASYRSKAVRVDSMDTPYFQKRFVRAVRLKGMEEEL